VGWGGDIGVLELFCRLGGLLGRLDILLFEDQVGAEEFAVGLVD
jgi:hypothetical protein